jgi:catechol-2,3-dioxygenase
VGASDHGPNKSVYAKDPDGLEFEVMWLVPADRWGAEEHEAIIRPLDIDAEQRHYADLVAEGRA